MACAIGRLRTVANESMEAQRVKIVVAVNGAVDCDVKVRVKSDNTGVDIANMRISMNPFDEIVVEEVDHGFVGDRYECVPETLDAV